MGQKLKKERELRGISLKEIADSTKINLRYLRALEEDKFDMLPGKFFIKSTIKAYSEYIGLEEETILDHFHHTLQIKKEEKKEQLEEYIPPTEVPRKFKIYLRIFGYTIIFMTALIIILLLIRGKLSVSVNEFTSITELPPSEETPSPLLNSFISNEGMVLKITFHQETWIKIFSDGNLYFTGLKQPGDQMLLTSKKEFLIHVGNAGGFDYSINGIPGKPLGKPGQVIKNFHITFQNYEKYLASQTETSPSSMI